jgi:hypothetical protein
MKLMEMAMSTGSISAPPSFSRPKRKKRRKKREKKDDGDEERDEERDEGSPKESS